MDNVDSITNQMYEFLNLVEQYGNPESETYDLVGVQFAHTVVEFYQDLKRLGDQYSNYVIILMKIMALWPSYEVHMTIGALDPTMPVKVFEYMFLWRDLYGNDVQPDERWILDHWNKIHLFENELRSNAKLSV